MADEQLLSNSVAAQALSEQLTERTQAQWALWLQNNRNLLRQVTFRIPFVKMAGGVFYNGSDITQFIELEKSRQLGNITLTPKAKEALDAFGVGTAYGGPYGQKLNVVNVTLQIDHGTRTEFVSVFAQEPLRVFRLELNEAKFLAEELLDCVGAGERHAQRAQHANEPEDLSGYEVVSDTQDALVMRVKS